MKKNILVTTAVHAVYYIVRDTAVSIYESARKCIAKGKKYRKDIKWEKEAKFTSKLWIVARAAVMFAAAVAYTIIAGVAFGLLTACQNTWNYIEKSRSVDAEFSVVEEEDFDAADEEVDADVDVI